MVLAHIHYNRYFEFCAIIFVLCSLFSHKNMHLQKCLTFGVHITCLCLFVLHFGRRGRPVQNCCRILQETSSAKIRFEFTFMPPTRMSFSSDLTEQVLQTVCWKLLQTELPLSPCAGTPHRFYAFRTPSTGSRGLCSARCFCSSDFYHYKRQIPLCQCPFEKFFRETLSLFIATSSKKLHILQILCK